MEGENKKKLTKSFGPFVVLDFRYLDFGSEVNFNIRAHLKSILKSSLVNITKKILTTDDF